MEMCFASRKTEVQGRTHNGAFSQVNKQILKEKQLLENKISRLEKSKVEETSALQQKADEDMVSIKAKLEKAETKIINLTEQVASTQSLLEERQEEMARMVRPSTASHVSLTAACLRQTRPVLFS